MRDLWNSIMFKVALFEAAILKLVLFCITCFATGHTLADESTFTNLLRENTIAWSGQPLKAGLDKLATNFDVPIWLDRRVDPSMLVDVSVSASRYDILRQIADKARLQMVVIPGLVIMARSQDADRIASTVLLAREMAKTDVMGKKLLVRRDFQWEEVSTPQEITRDIAELWKVELEFGWIPHDLWAARQWHAMDAVTLLALLGTSFDRMPQFRSGKLQWIELPDRIAISTSYRVTKDVVAVKSQVMEQDKYAKWELDAMKTLILEATAKGHEVISLYQAKRSSQPPNASTTAKQHRYSLKVRAQPVRRVIEQIANAEKWNLQWQAATERGEQLVSFDATDQTALELIQRACQQAGLEAALQENQLMIQAKAIANEEATGAP